MKVISRGKLARIARRAAVLPLPTRLGWYFLGAALLLFFAGTFYSHNSFLMLSSLPFALLLVNAVVVWVNVRRISFKRQHPAQTHAGENIEVTLLVHNQGRGPRFALELDDTRLPDRYRDQSANLVMSVSAGYVHRCGYAAAFGRRGYHRLRQCVVSSSFPFGLMRKSRQLSFRSDILVYPRPARLSEALERRLLKTARYFGESSVASRGQEEVYGVREYLPGQNVSRIHWRTTARAAKPMILELEGRQDASFALLLDTAPVGDPATLRQRLEAAIGLFAGLTWFLTRQGVMFRFAWHGSALHASRPGRGDAHYHAVMERLALAGFADKRLGEWIEEVGVGALHEVPVLVTLGAQEHAEAALRAGREAIVLSTADPDFRQHLRFDGVGRRSVATQDLPAMLDEGGAA